MTIKRMMAGLMAGILMMGTLSTTCFAAAADSDSTEKMSEVLEENALRKLMRKSSLTM